MLAIRLNASANRSLLRFSSHRILAITRTDRQACACPLTMLGHVMSRLSVQEPLRPKTQKRLSVCFCVLRLCEGKECTAGAWALLWTGPQGFSCFLSGTPCAEARRLRGPAGRGVQCRPPTAGVPAYWLRDGASISTASLSLSLSLSLLLLLLGAASHAAVEAETLRKALRAASTSGHRHN